MSTAHADQRCQTERDDEDSPVELPYLCSVAHRFTEVYSSPGHVSVLKDFGQFVVTRLVEEEDEEDEEYLYEGYDEEEVDDGFEDEDSYEEERLVLQSRATVRRRRVRKKGKKRCPFKRRRSCRTRSGRKVGQRKRKEQVTVSSPSLQPVLPDKMSGLHDIRDLEEHS
ncbi:microtubule-associated serine/threonine-protein kinase 3-like [Scomber scombrus]|uniref:Microtubule-associated serine/threonine-protein kinase 3-like n=1 Tax=Scomber scombrus TaxID=13677 RepID=A0AAV1Q1N9_SCOSC